MMLSLKNVCTNALAIKPFPFHAIRNILEAIKGLQSTQQLLKDHQLVGKFHSVSNHFYDKSNYCEIQGRNDLTA